MEINHQSLSAPGRFALQIRSPLSSLGETAAPENLLLLTGKVG